MSRNRRSWARLCPRSDMSAGKHRSRHIQKGAAWLEPTLARAARSATRANGTYFQVQMRRLRPRMGAKKAIIAVAASMLTSIDYVLLRREPYRELGPHHLDERDKKYTLRSLTRRIQALGYQVQVQPTVTAS